MVGEGKSETGMAGAEGTSSPQPPRNHARAWVLARAEKPAEAVKKLWHGDASHMIVRAEVIKGAGPKNIIVPVDAANGDQLKEAVRIIKRDTGDDDPTVAEVTLHYPSRPGEGRDLSPEEGQILGRNGWG